MDRFARYLERHFDFSHVLDTGTSEAEPPKMRVGSGKKLVLLGLQAVPYLCLAAFLGAVFFHADFDHTDRLVLFGYDLSLHQLVLRVSVSGLIGYGTNYLAIKMLFRPRQKRPIWGQGLIPANKDRIAHKLAVTINHHLLNEDELKRKLHDAQVIQKTIRAVQDGADGLFRDEEFTGELQAQIEKWLHDFLGNEGNRNRIVEEVVVQLQQSELKGVTGTLLRAYTRLNRKAIRTALDQLVARVPAALPALVDPARDIAQPLQENLLRNTPELEARLAHAVHDLVDRMDIYRLLRNQITNFDEGQLEDMLWSATNEQLLYIQYLGGLLGMLGGLVLWQPEAVSFAFVVLGGGLFLFDQLLYRLRARP